MSVPLVPRKRNKEPVNFVLLEDALAAIKPHILDFSRADFVMLEANLTRLNDLLDQLLPVQRNTKRRTADDATADALDREGVQLWNASILLRGVQDHGEPESRTRVFASLRLAAFRLIEAGGDGPPTSETLIHLLQLASKTATALSECQDGRARNVMMSAAEYESQLKNMDDVRDSQSKESAIAQYYCGRMDAAWKENNESVAYFMLEQAVDERRLDIMTLPDVEEVLGRALEIGKALLRKSWGKQTATMASTLTTTQDTESAADGKTAAVATKWLQKAFQVLERVKQEESSSLPILREAILRTLARAYFASSTVNETNLERAEATLDEVIRAKDPSDVDINLLWMRLAILKRGKATVAQLSNAFRSILNRLELREAEVLSFLREVQAIVNTRQVVYATGSTSRNFGYLSIGPIASVNLAITASQELLERVLDAPNGTGQPFVDSVTMSLLLLVKSLSHSDAHSAAERACQTLARRVDLSLEKASAAACQLVLWRNGETSYKAKRWTEAADWFILSASPAFRCMTEAQSRCIRKAALCYIQQGEYAQASILVSRCSQDESATHYIIFLAAVHQGLEAEAIQAVEDMLRTSDFDRRMLLLATQLAHETKQKSLLLAILEAMYTTLQRESHIEAETEGITLVRCGIRIVLDLLKEPLAATSQLIGSLKTHLGRALNLISAMSAKDNLAVIAKDVSWIWRSAYNAAVAGCHDWEELVVVEIFDLSRELMEAYSTTLAGTRDPDLKQCILLSSFSAISGRLFVARRLGSSQSAADLYARLVNDIPASRQYATEALGNGAFDDEQPTYIINLLFTFEIEVLCRMNEWQRVETTVKMATEMDCVTSTTLEAMADLLWTEDTCPTDVLYTGLEAMLRSSLDSRNISIDKFSRWLRAMCTILLARNKQHDRANALSFIEQAVEVIKDNKDGTGGQMYAHDEREWLLHIAFNTGVERFAVSDLGEAKRWIETATALAGLVHNGEAASKKIKSVYQQVLTKYSTPQ